ncbi:hypothetical protein [Xanthobacter autotrophicus]|jgi:hypothetical protein|uniref:Uncharacterized protein n=1 Tax=Xanthobacter autotrophicus TaxID=280 RepID=A0A6C1KKX3_XANAU|nr:hypothetical protein [Xanthobacter autotrophicus]TLX44968.1 hypothetical protein FBQ73_00625 [Xanthobacter autotrophicus]
MAEENVDYSKVRATVWSVITSIGYLAQVAWANCPRWAKFGLVGMVLGFMAFGPAGAGIAAFGSAIGVKLFVLTGVLGSGLSGFVKAKKSDKS